MLRVVAAVPSLLGRVCVHLSCRLLTRVFYRDPTLVVDRAQIYSLHECIEFLKVCFEDDVIIVLNFVGAI